MSDETTERDVEALAGVLRQRDRDDGQHIASDHWKSVARAVLASDWYAERIAEARREGAADELDRRAEGINPGDHHCFKPWCPHCQARKVREQARDALHARAAALRGDASPPPSGPDYAPTGGPVSPFGPFPKAGR